MAENTPLGSVPDYAHFEQDTDLAVFMLSGGMDSTALILDNGYVAPKRRGLYVSLGQHSDMRQQAAVKRLSIKHNLPLDIGPLTGMTDFFLPVSEPPHPMVAEVGTRGESSAKVILTAALYACEIGAQKLVHAATSEDVAVAPNLPDMLQQIQMLVRSNSKRAYFVIEAPYLGISRDNILKKLIKYDPDIFTWSCLWGGLYHCGKCQGCQNRQKRYSDASIADPTIYSMEYLSR